MRHFGASALILLALCLVLILGCSSMQNRDIAVVIEKEMVLDSLPSGSGLIVEGDKAWIISDDATGIYALSLADGTFSKIPFQQYDTSIYRIPKPVKPDFESAVKGRLNGKDYIFGFGSGALSPFRDSVLMYNPEDKQLNVVGVDRFYNALRKQASLDSGELNIEGAVITSGRLYLLNRGRNLLFDIDWSQFSSYLTSPAAKKFPEVTFREVQLPVSNGLQAGFSGACSLDRNRVIFSASLEDTRDWIADGAVYGSYIGILAIGKDKVTVEAIAPLKDASGQTVKDKVESIDIIRRHSDNSIQMAAIVDNDDGSSKLLMLKLSYQ